MIFFWNFHKKKCYYVYINGDTAYQYAPFSTFSNPVGLLSNGLVQF